MFSWFKNLFPTATTSLGTMSLEFGQMLDAGRYMFLTAANALLGGTDPEVIRRDLFSTDRRINRSEQQIRREIVVSASVHGSTHIPACLTFMTIVKDAERIGDYAKNIFDLIIEAPPLEHDDFHKDLVELKDTVSECLSEARRVFDAQDEEAARVLTRRLVEMEDHCDAQVKILLRDQEKQKAPASLVLAYRYFKRVLSHCMNITTSIFMPLDKIDYFDEKPRPDTDTGETPKAS